MSVEAVTFSQLKCDGCGKTHPDLTRRGATSIRIAASNDGWKFAEFDDVPRNQKGVRLWDSCAECPLPSTGAEAHAMKKGRQP